jgi:uncharacterized protein YndB with AHSA1/START domain
MVARSSAMPGFTLDLPSDLEIRMTRGFDAPARLVFEAFTKPEYMKRWWGPRCVPLHICEIDFRVGGAFRLVGRGPDNIDHAFHGIYREIVRPERLVFTQIYEPYPDDEALVTVTLAERDGVTLLTCTILHASKEARDGHVQSGMKDGAAESYDRLAELVASLA